MFFRQSLLDFRMQITVQSLQVSEFRYGTPCLNISSLLLTTFVKKNEILKNITYSFQNIFRILFALPLQ